jgi:DUF971 family protein
MTAVNPTEITLHQRSRVLEIAFEDGCRFELPFELMRVYSPSAEVRGHGPGQEILQVGKQNVGISDIRPIGNYGICPTFSDGHNTGIYTWEFLYELGSRRQALWEEYLERLKQAGQPRPD